MIRSSIETRTNKMHLFCVGSLESYDVEFVTIEAPSRETAQCIADRLYGKNETQYLGIPHTLSVR